MHKKRLPLFIAVGAVGLLLPFAMSTAAFAYSGSSAGKAGASYRVADMSSMGSTDPAPAGSGPSESGSAQDKQPDAGMDSMNKSEPDKDSSTDSGSEMGSMKDSESEKAEGDEPQGPNMPVLAAFLLVNLGVIVTAAITKRKNVKS